MILSATKSPIMNYAIVILPPQYLITCIRNLKHQLQRMASWYPSVNADAHLTISSFGAGTRYYGIWQRRLDGFCAMEIPFHVRFDSIRFFSESNTFYLAPDAASRTRLKALMGRFQQKTNGLGALNTTEPHITIGRNLSVGQVSIADDFLKRKLVGLSFECNRLYIRKLNLGRGQYDLFYSQPFGSQPPYSIIPELDF
jgi:2'-5' RNA ligase